MPVWIWVFFLITMDPNHYQRSSITPGDWDFIVLLILKYCSKYFKIIILQTTMLQWWWKRPAPFIFTDPLYTGPGRVCAWIEVDECSLRQGFKNTIALKDGVCGVGGFKSVSICPYKQWTFLWNGGIPLTRNEIPKIHIWCRLSFLQTEN